jgi:hypothetical protein
VSRRGAIGVALAAVLLGVAAPASAQEVSPKGYIEMPQADDGAWVLTAPPGSGRNWGKPVFVRYLALVAREWKRRHPDLPRLRIGDMSKPDGSSFPPHKTHKDGLTADIFTSPKNICHVSYPNQEHTLELAEIMVAFGAKQILYNGELVISKTIAKKWPKHDNHFHIVIDPNRVPADGAPLLIPGGPYTDGAWVPRRALEDDGTGLELSWNVLGGAKLKHWQVVVERQGADAPLHDSGPLKRNPGRYRLPVALEDGQTYRWKVTVTTAAGETVDSGWETVQTDFQTPEVAALGPSGEEEVGAPVRLRWRFTKPGVAQRRYRIELDGDSNHRKIKKALGPFDGTAGEHAVEVKALKRNKRYFWRVVAEDAHGNEGASAWQAFRTGRRYGLEPAGEGPKPQSGSKRSGSVDASALNVRSGPSTGNPVVTVLKRGAEVQILGETNGWLEVVAPDGKRGYVSKRYVTER